MRVVIAGLCGLLLVNFIVAGEEGVKTSTYKGLPEVPVPEDNPMSQEKIELGKMLYFDSRLSIDNTVSCASCHDPAKGWSNGEAVATGVDGKKGGRNSPTVINTAYQKYQFWDGRAGSLEEQALGPIQNPIEMNMSLDAVVEKLNKIAGYKLKFQAVFKTDVTKEGIAKAIAAFERTVISHDAPYDRYKTGDKKAMSETAVKGMELFFGKANCSACHSGPNFTDNSFHNLGVSVNAKELDKGREVISKIEGDRASFKTPTLRDIKKTGPYMHDGSVNSLHDVVKYYNQGGTPNEQLDEEVFAIKLTDKEIEELVKFLEEGLSSHAYPDIKAPKLPE